uniref:Plasmid stabilization protein n=1 Tax=uncultured marine virus TaxID=186617 RepID=A0A0F7L7Z3_9VIRU|nr:plasmid stabilization protein [uncultured marine virus]
MAFWSLFIAARRRWPAMISVVPFLPSTPIKGHKSPRASIDAAKVSTPLTDFLDRAFSGETTRSLMSIW